jgi:UDPglucose 6-dehydrogenase
MKISVIGSGYVGLVTAACFSELGNKVTCLDISKTKINSLKKSIIPFYEPGLKALVDRNLKCKNLSFTSKYSDSRDEKIYFICVGTPQRKRGSANLDYLFSAIDSLLTCFDETADQASERHIFIKSTVPPGTIRKIEKRIVRSKLKFYVSVSSNPEFLKEGAAINDFMKPDRVVIGSDSKSAKKICKELYKPIIWKSNRFIETTPESSEIIKYASNAFLATKISFINEIAKLTDFYGGDINEIRSGMGSDVRINPNFLYAGIGFGGSCFPKDLSGLIHAFDQAKINSDLIKATLKVNDNQKDYFLQKIYDLYSADELLKKTITIWGIAFKSNTDDIRESVGMKIVQELSPKVANINVYDAIALKNAKNELSNLKNISFYKSLPRSIKNAHFLIIATDSKEFWSFDHKLLTSLQDKRIFDGRNMLDMSAINALGIQYFGVGRG